MQRRMPENMRQKRYAHFATNSPLKPSRDDIVYAANRGNTQETLVRHKRTFVLDGSRQLPSNQSVLPSYNAYTDRHSQIYFRSPRVQAMLRKADAVNKGEPFENISGKLSSRQRLPATPLEERLKRKENRFVIDSVRVDHLKTKRRPIIPQYDGTVDIHTKNYYKKESVKSLIERTCGIKI